MTTNQYIEFDQVSKIDPSKILRTVSFEEGFHFSTKTVYAGITAISLLDFLGKLKTVNLDSLFFHYQRGDFQKWITHTLGDTDLADRIELTNRTIFNQQTIFLEELRYFLRKIIEKRIAEFKITRVDSSSAAG
jgi:hypothetical protein